MSAVPWLALLVAAAAIAWLWKRRTPGTAPALIRVAFRGGRIVETDGRVPRLALDAFTDVAAMTDLSGELRVLATGELWFSDDVAPGVRQQLRNAWMTSRHVH